MLVLRNLFSLIIYKFGSLVNKQIKGEKKNITNKTYFHLIKNFKKNGYVIIENYITVNECEYIKTIIDDFCYLNSDQIWSHKEQSEKRIFGAEYIDKKIENFFLDKNIEDFASEVYNTRFKNMMVMANKIHFTNSNLGSGSGWHRDSVNHQFKAILYLSDVDSNNGAFQLVKGSEKKINLIKDSNLINQNVLNTRISNASVQKILKKNPEKLITVTGKCGTLIIVNTSMIHRGKPLNKNNRYALTNYYYQSYKIEKNKTQFQPMVNKKFF